MDGNEESQEKKTVARTLPVELSFDLDRKKIPVKMKDPKTGNILEYTLQELDGAERDRYLNNVAQRMKVDRQGRPAGIKDFKDLQADLVSRSLVDKDGSNIPVQMIQKWPVSVQSQLFKTAQALSALEEADEEEAKND